MSIENLEIKENPTRNENVEIETLINRKINNTLKAVSELEVLINTAKPILLSKSNVQVDSAAILTAIETIKSTIPSELADAQLVVSTMDDILHAAEIKSNKIEEQAMEKAERILSENHIIKEATSRAEDIVAEAYIKKEEIEQDAYNYLMKLFNSSEEGLNDMLNAINKLKASTIEIAKKDKVKYTNLER